MQVLRSYPASLPPPTSLSSSHISPHRQSVRRGNLVFSGICMMSSPQGHKKKDGILKRFGTLFKGNRGRQTLPVSASHPVSTSLLDIPRPDTTTRPPTPLSYAEQPSSLTHTPTTRSAAILVSSIQLANIGLPNVATFSPHRDQPGSTVSSTPGHTLESSAPAAGDSPAAVSPLSSSGDISGHAVSSFSPMHTPSATASHISSLLTSPSSQFVPTRWSTTSPTSPPPVSEADSAWKSAREYLKIAKGALGITLKLGAAAAEGWPIAKGAIAAVQEILKIAEVSGDDGR